MKTVFMSAILVLSSTFAHAAASLSLNESDSKSLYKAMSNAGFTIEASNAGSSYYGRIHCQRATQDPQPGKDFTCIIVDSDPNGN